MVCVFVIEVQLWRTLSMIVISKHAETFVVQRCIGFILFKLWKLQLLHLVFADSCFGRVHFSHGNFVCFQNTFNIGNLRHYKAFILCKMFITGIM